MPDLDPGTLAHLITLQNGRPIRDREGPRTLAQCVRFYEPHVLAWLFETAPSGEITVACNLDVSSYHDRFDRALQLRRAEGQEVPFQPGFSALSMVLQLFGGDVDRAHAHFGRFLSTDEEHRLFNERAWCAWNWVTDVLGPRGWRFQLRETPTVRLLNPRTRAAVGKLIQFLETHPEVTREDTLRFFREIQRDIRPELFCPLLFNLILGQDKGPSFPVLIPTLGSERVLSLLRPSFEKTA